MPGLYRIVETRFVDTRFAGTVIFRGHMLLRRFVDSVSFVSGLDYFSFHSLEVYWNYIGATKAAPVNQERVRKS